jgi:hypothetical protein
LGASFHGGRLLATCLVYLLERFYFCGGRIARLGRISCRRTSSHQIAVRSVAEGGHSAELHSCGGVSRSELTVCSWSSFSGFASLYVGRTFWGALGGFGLVYQLSLSCYCIRFHHILYLLYSIFCFPHIYIYIPNWFSPGGFYPGSC